MAHFLQRLILAAAGASLASAQTKPFSHRLHLALKLECTGCHTAAAASTLASDNNLPDAKTCRRCHDQPMPSRSPTATLVTRFSHTQHSKLGNVAPVLAAAISGKTYHASVNGEPPAAGLGGQLKSANACAACHRGLEESEAVTKAAFPAMPDCLVCHPKIDNPFSCEMCHAAGAHLKPASHTRHYIDFHSTGKANLNKQSCVICHGKKFTCLGCH